MYVRFVIGAVVAVLVGATAGAAPVRQGPEVATGATAVAERVPLPPRRPGRAAVVGRVEQGRVVPLAPQAFAARAEGPVASLFAAAEAGATAAPLPAPVAVAVQEPAQTVPAAVAAAPASVPMLAGHGGGGGFDRYDARSGSLAAALNALKADRYGEAIERRNGLKDPLDRKIVDYFLMRSGTDRLTTAMLADYGQRMTGWPDQGLLRTRAEEALARERPSPEIVIRATGGSARSHAGLRLLANAHLARGDRAKAAELVRATWLREPMGLPMQAAFAGDFSALLTADDHLIRVDRLIAADRTSEAKALRERLGSGPRAYLAARVAAAEGAGNAKALLSQVPAEYRKRPGYRLAQLTLARRAEDWAGAAAIIEGQPVKGVVDGDGWWTETRIVARSLAERGEGRRAYQLASRGTAQDAEGRADEAFHAGWFALVHLKDGRRADGHFAALEGIATTPITRARASYWRGRAAEESGNGGAARRHYANAGQYGFTYYGQLARAALGETATGQGRVPEPTAADRAAIANNEVAQAVRRLIAADHDGRIWPLMEHLAETLPTPGQVALVMADARKAGHPHLALMMAKEAQRRGLPVGGLAFPTSEIPKSATVPAGLDRALVYAIARQESLFNPGAVSPVGAKGLMQVMPKTAAAMAKELRLKHSPAKMSDPAYNATLGAAYLHKRLGEFDGSFVLTFAAYNAGASRAREWVQRFGDPRDPRVDPVTWVESIPYPETRNYVMRVMENVQVYRELLGTGRLAIREDLGRGRSS